MDPVAALAARLHWRTGQSREEEERWCKRTGTSLLLWAVTCNDLAATEVLLGAEGGRKHLERGLRRAWPGLSLWAKSTPLHMAMSFAGPDVVEALLDAGASPEARTGGNGNDPLHSAAMCGSVENIEAWLRRHPSWDLERREKIAGCTALMIGLFPLQQCGRSLAVADALLSRGAKADAVQNSGGNILHFVAGNPDMKPDDLAALLALPQVHAVVGDLLNVPCLPRNRLYKLLSSVSRTAPARSACCVPTSVRLLLV